MICLVIPRDSFAVKESDLFDCLLNWSVFECQRQGIDWTPVNQRAVMFPFLQYIRFPTMCLSYLQNVVERSEILTQDEIISINQSIGLPSSFPGCGFPREPRLEAPLPCLSSDNQNNNTSNPVLQNKKQLNAVNKQLKENTKKGSQKTIFERRRSPIKLLSFKQFDQQLPVSQTAEPRSGGGGDEMKEDDVERKGEVNKEEDEAKNNEDEKKKDLETRDIPVNLCDH